MCPSRLELPHYHPLFRFRYVAKQSSLRSINFGNNKRNYITSQPLAATFYYKRGSIDGPVLLAITAVLAAVGVVISIESLNRVAYTIPR